MEIKPQIETFAKIKVVGVGGGGTSAVNRMVEQKIKSLISGEFVMSFLKKILIAIVTTLFLAGCHQAAEPKDTIKVGVIAGPEAKLMEVAKQVAEKEYGLQF